MVRMGRCGLTVCGIVILVACGETKDGKNESPASGGSGGTGGSGTSGGAAGSTGGIIITGGSSAAGTNGVGAFGGNLVITPPATVDLQVCASIVDDGTADGRGACFLCCVDGGFENDAFFDYKCACARPVDGAGSTVCGSATADECSTCCLAANYWGSGFTSSATSPCICLHRSNSSVCASTLSSRNACAVCCINAGYISSAFPGNACECRDG